MTEIIFRLHEMHKYLIETLNYFSQPLPTFALQSGEVIQNDTLVRLNGNLLSRKDQAK